MSSQIFSYGNRIVDSKVLEYKETISKQTTTFKQDVVNFVLEKLTSKNINYWVQYHEDQELNTRRMGAYTEKSSNPKFIPIIDGISSFGICLEMFLLTIDVSKEILNEKNYTEVKFNDKSSNYDIWIAYATRTNVNSMDVEVKHEDIEMTFCVFINEKLPVTSHMGIFRNYLFFRKDKNPHDNLSLYLHSFAALTSNILYKNKHYMITKPADKMRELMYGRMKSKNKLDYIWISDNNERKRLNVKHYDFNNNLLNSNEYRSMNSEILLTQLSKFQFPTWFMKYLQREFEALLIKVNDFKIKLEEDKDFKESLGDLLIGKYNYLDMLKYELDLFDRKRKKQHFETIKSITSKDELLKRLDEKKNKFIYNKIFEENNNILGRIKRLTIYDLHPVNPEEQVPVTNMDNKIWSLKTLGLNLDLEFDRPQWFDHRHLNNHLPTVMINIKELGKLFNED
jgi:hypothetical protein